MSTMNKILIGLAVVQLGLLLALRLGGGSEDQNVKPHALLDFDPAAVTHIEIQDGTDSKPLVLERREKEWVIASLDGFPAKADKVWDEKGQNSSALLNTIANVRVTDPVLTRGESHAVAKVAADAFEKRVLLKDTGGKTLAEFFVAAVPGSVGSFYVRSAGDDDVYQSDTLTSYALSTSTTSWVSDTAYVQWPKEDVTRLQVQPRDGDPITLVAKSRPAAEKKKPEDDAVKDTKETEKTNSEKHEEVTWSVEGSDVQLDSKKVEDFLGKICSITLEDVLGKQAPEDLDAKNPLVSFEITFKDGESKTLSILGKQKNDFVVKASTSPFFVRVYAWSLEKAAAFDLKDLMPEKKEEEKPAKAPQDGETSPKKEHDGG